MNEQMGTNVTSAPVTDVEVALNNPVNGSEAQNVKPDASAASSVGSTATPAWMAQLPNDLKGNDNLKGFATLGDAIRNLMEPKTAETPAEVKTEPVKYQNFSKKLDTDDDPFGDIGKSMQDYFESNGMKQQDAEAFFDAYSKIMSDARQKMMEKGLEYCTDAVKKRWGNDYDRKRSQMARGYQALGDTDGSLQKRLDTSGLSLSPDMWDILAKVGELVSEDSGSPVKGTGGSNGGLFAGGVPVDYSTPSI